jgi:hypothetical protein
MRARLHRHFGDPRRLLPYGSAQAVVNQEAEHRLSGQRGRPDPQNHGPWLTADRAPPIFGDFLHGAVRRQAPSSLEADGRPRGKRERPAAQNQVPSPTAVASVSAGDFTAAIARMPHEKRHRGGVQPELGSASREERGHCSEE